mgnify:FL=1
MRLRTTTPLILASGLLVSLAGSIHAATQGELPSGETPTMAGAYDAPGFGSDLESLALESTPQETEAHPSPSEQDGPSASEESSAPETNRLSAEAFVRLDALLSGTIPFDLDPRILEVLVQNAQVLGPGRVRDFLDAVSLAGDELAAWSRLARTQMVAPMDSRPGPGRVAAVLTLEDLMVHYAGTEIGDRAESLHFKLTRLARGCRPPWFIARDPLGNEVRSTDLLGQVVFVRIMGSDSDAERAALRKDLEFSRRHWDDPIVMVGIATDPDRRQLHERLDTAQVHWPISWEVEGEEGLLVRWRLDAQSTFLIGPNGRVAGVNLSPVDLESRLQWLWGGSAPLEQDSPSTNDAGGATDIPDSGPVVLPNQPVTLLPTTPFTVSQAALSLTSGAARFQRIQRALRHAQRPLAVQRLRDLARTLDSFMGHARDDG